MDSPIVARGKGYQGDTTFDGFEVLAEPLASRESRSFPAADGGPGVTYASHSVKLARRVPADWENKFERRRRSPDLFVLMEHGAGRLVIKLHVCYNNPDALEALLAMPERALYGVLYGFAAGAEGADYAARGETAREYQQAFIEKRLRKSRPRQGRVYVTIEPRPAAPAITTA